MSAKRARRRIFKKAERDENEKDILHVVERYGVEYSLADPGDGYDFLLQIQPMTLIEVKNPSYKWTLTDAENKKMLYCQERGIGYHIVETEQQISELVVLLLDEKA